MLLSRHRLERACHDGGGDRLFRDSCAVVLATDLRRLAQVRICGILSRLCTLRYQGPGKVVHAALSSVSVRCGSRAW
jgi:hypothetical protein